MALKGDRVILETDITSICDSTTAEEGVILVHKTAGSGVSLGDTAGHVELAASASGTKVAGLLIGDVVNVDQTRTHLNFHKNESVAGEPVTLVRKGKLTTNKLVSGATPTAGQTAYLTANGEVTPTKSTTGGLAATPPVGEFKSKKDENGYVTIELNLPFPVV